MVDKRGKIKLLVLVSSVLLIGMFLFLSAVTHPTSNIKEYDSVNKVVTIKSSSGDVISDITLNTPLNNIVPRGYGKVAEFTINLSDDTYSGAFEKIDFYDLKKGNRKFLRDFDYKYKTYENVEINDYKKSCEKLENGTATNCQKIITGTHMEQREVWDILDTSILYKGEVTVGIFTEVKKGDHVEWIPTFLGVEINEWAEWTEDLNVGLKTVFSMDHSGSTNTVLNNVTGGNGTIEDSDGSMWVGGKLGNAIEFHHSDSETGKPFINVTNSSLPQSGDSAWSLWIKTNESGSSHYILGIFKDANLFNFVIRMTNGNLGVRNGDCAAGLDSANTNGRINDSNWHHVAVNRELTADNISVWIDGVYNFSLTSTDNGCDGSFAAIGIVLPQRQFSLDADIDQFLAWNRTLTESEISDLWNDGSGISYTNVFNEPPTAPTLSSPTNNSNFAMNSTITFTWNNSTDADGDTITYDLEIYNESDMAAANFILSNTSITEGSDPTFIEINLSEYTTTDDIYYWRVRANDSSTTSSDWSDTWQFQYANWTITFNLTDSSDGIQIDTMGGQVHVDISCDNGFTATEVENPHTSTTDAFAAGTWECTFSGLLGYFDTTQNITADNDKTEEINTWKRISRTDTGVITQETFVSNTLNSTSNITLNYTIDIPFKAGYAIGELLPLRMFFWFTDVNKTICYNQDKASDTNRAESPYCLPLVAETLGPNNGTVTFTVDLRPNLADGNYNITRSIEIDPIVNGEVTWTNYGQENIGQVKIEEQNDDPSINLNKLGEIFPSTAEITGAVLGIGSYLISGWQIVSIMAIIGLVLVVAIVSRTRIKLKEK